MQFVTESIVKTFNKKGDSGETSLLFGCRVAKNDYRCEAYGAIDEAVSALGIARTAVTHENTRQIILKVQKELFTVGAELACPLDDYDRMSYRVTPEMSNELEKLITDLESRFQMPDAFIIPGANPGSAYLDLARAITRRAERRVVSLKEQGGLKNEAVLQYMNRLADLLFTLARYEEQPYG